MLPTSPVLAVPVALSCVAEVRGVARVTEPKITVTPGAKCAPVMVKEKVPTGMVRGETVVICGVAFRSRARMWPAFLGSLVTKAETVMVFAAGGNSGAVYRPVGE